jgi:hypothetical protein
VFENTVLRRIFGSRKDEVTGSWRGLHIEGLHNSYSSPSNVLMIKSRSLSWAEHVALMRKLEVKKELGLILKWDLEG